MALVDLEQGILAPLTALSSLGMSEWAWSRTGKPFRPWGITESSRQADSSGQADHAASERKYWPSAEFSRDGHLGVRNLGADLLPPDRQVDN